MNSETTTEYTGIIPENLHRIHILGICGTGMAALAGMLRERGYAVTGSDSNVYPPMSDFLRELSIPVYDGYRPDNLDSPRPRPDLVVVGNVIRRDNPEAEHMRELHLPHVSFPQILSQLFIEGNQSLVVAGTHGKTTTCSLLAWVLEYAGLDPSFMIGGIVKNFMKNYKVGNGPYFVAEGDEYDTAYFDKGPKFLHYRPNHVILTSVEFDHADIYRDLDHVKSSFRRLLEIVPREGLLLARAENEGVADVIAGYPGLVQSFGGPDSNARWTASVLDLDGGICRFRVFHEGKSAGDYRMSMWGSHNVMNALSVVALTRHLGIDPEAVREGIADFQGVKRRQEIRGVERGVTVIDDFAHHPTEVRETVAAVRSAYPSSRLIAVFEPRTNTSRQKVFQSSYPESFTGADLVILREPADPEKFPESNRFSSRALAVDINARNIPARCFGSTDEIVRTLAAEAHKGDVLLIMSNGGFDNIHLRMLDLLRPSV